MGMMMIPLKPRKIKFADDGKVGSAPMNKANNRFAFYMLMFCSVGTLGNLVLLNVVRFGALAPSCLVPHASCGSPRLHSARSCACAAPIDLHGMSYERSEGSKKY